MNTKTYIFLGPVIDTATQQHCITPPIVKDVYYTRDLQQHKALNWNSVVGKNLLYIIPIKIVYIFSQYPVSW
jgi:hypothetical protein